MKENKKNEYIEEGLMLLEGPTSVDTNGVPDFNEYVWVSIPESSYFARTAWTGLSPTEASSACTKNTSTDNMHLMYGIEWDSILNWLKNKATYQSLYKIKNSG